MTSPTVDYAAEAIKFALAQVGKPYVWGAVGPNAYDCSGLIYAAYQHAGYHNITRTTSTQIAQGVPLDPSTPVDQRPAGVLVFPHHGHVYMALGGGRIVEAATTGIPVHVRNDYAPKAVAIRQLAPTAGQVSDVVTTANPNAATTGLLDNVNPLSGFTTDFITHALDVLLNWITYVSLTAIGGGLMILGAVWLLERPATALGRALPRLS